MCHGHYMLPTNGLDTCACTCLALPLGRALDCKENAALTHTDCHHSRSRLALTMLWCAPTGACWAGPAEPGAQGGAGQPGQRAAQHARQRRLLQRRRLPAPQCCRQAGRQLWQGRALEPAPPPLQAVRGPVKPPAPACCMCGRLPCRSSLLHLDVEASLRPGALVAASATGVSGP